MEVAVQPSIVTAVVSATVPERLTFAITLSPASVGVQALVVSFPSAVGYQVLVEFGVPVTEINIIWVAVS